MYAYIYSGIILSTLSFCRFYKEERSSAKGLSSQKILHFALKGPLRQFFIQLSTYYYHHRRNKSAHLEFCIIKFQLLSTSNVIQYYVFKQNRKPTKTSPQAYAIRL